MVCCSFKFCHPPREFGYLLEQLGQLADSRDVTKGVRPILRRRAKYDLPSVYVVYHNTRCRDLYAVANAYPVGDSGLAAKRDARTETNAA
jgi:hypothetical protein